MSPAFEESQHIIVASHRRSGTHLTIDAIHNNVDPYSGSYLNLDRLIPSHSNPLPIQDFTDQLSKGPRLVKSHMYPDVDAFFSPDSQPAQLAQRFLNNARVIYVHRDGRDVMTSLYYYLQDHHRDRMKNTPFSEFLRAERFIYSGARPNQLSHAAYWNFHVTRWLDRDDVLFLSFEKMVSDYTATIEEIGRVLELDLPENITNVVRTRKIDPRNQTLRTTLTRLDGLYRRILSTIGGREFTTTNFRKGTVGNYRELFSTEDLRYMNDVAGSALETLGYAT